jgi:hypothetical protein
MTTTKDNLKEAFSGESQANQKYRAFAKKAEAEGFATSPSCSAPPPRLSASTPRATSRRST